MENKTLEIILKAKDEASKVLGDFDKTLEKSQTTLNKFGSIMTKVGVGALALGATAIVAGKKMVDAYAEAEAQMQVANTAIKTFSNDTLKTMGGSVDSATKQVADFGVKLMKLGGISDEEASIGVTKLTQTTGDYTKAQQLAMMAADLATYKHISYESAVSAVQKMVSGSTKEIKAMGLAVEEGATVEQNMAVVLGIVKNQYEDSGKTIEGRTKILKESFGNVSEALGEKLLPIATWVLQKFMDFIPIIENVVEKIGTFITKVSESEAVKKIIEIIKNAFLSLWDSIKALWASMQPLMPYFELLGKIIGGVLLVAFLAIIGAIKVFVDVLTWTYTTIFNIYTFINKYFIKVIKEDIKNAIETAGKAFEWLGNIAKSVFQGIVNFIQPIINAVDKLIEGIVKIKDKIGGAIGNAVSSVSGFFGGGKANGGDVNLNKSYIVGESGPEIFIPNQNGTIVPNKSMSNGTTINITVTGNQLLDKNSGKIIADAIFKDFKLKTNFA